MQLRHLVAGAALGMAVVTWPALAEDTEAGDGAPSATVTLEAEAIDAWQAEAQASPEAAEEAAGDLLTLEQALALAMEQNPSLDAALARIEQAQQRVLQARSLYYPSVNARYNVSKAWISGNDRSAIRQQVERQQRASLSQRLGGALGGQFGGTVGGVVVGTGGSVNVPALLSTIAIWGAETRQALRFDTTREQYAAGVEANWIVFDGFERRYNLAAARIAAEETATLYDEISRQLLAAVADTYYRAQLARQLIRIVEADEAFQERQLREAEARRRVGTGSLSDMLNFEVRKNQARANRIDAERAYAIALIGLATLVGMPEGYFPEGIRLSDIADEQPGELAEPDIDDLLVRARSERPDLEQQRLAVERSQAGVGAARAPFFPRVVASASVDAARDNDAWLDANDYSQSLALGVSYELFAGGRNRAALVEAREREKEARWELTARELDAAQEVRNAAERVEAAQQLLILERRNAELVQRARDLVEREYRAGQASLVRLNEAQRDLIQAEAALVRALVGLRQSWYELRAAIGDDLLQEVPR